jgi:D-beta-D-heptose 7-phosphate kinase / D-beta-D-heptose 1-phosphate adenosyltransferase
MYKKLLKAVGNLGNARVLLVGDFILDSYVYGDATRISPEAPVQVLKVVGREYNCGGAGSVAMDLQALGAKVSCLGVVGKDDNGKLLRKLLSLDGIDTSGLIKASDRPTITKERIVGLAQHRHRQQLLRIDDECTEPLKQKQHDKILQLYKDRLGDSDIVCLQDYDKAVLSDGLCGEMIKLASLAGKKVLIDPAVINDYSKYRGASVVTPNRTEASKVVGFDIKTIGDAQRAGEKLLAEFDFEAVVVTIDRDGMFLVTKQQSRHIATVPRSVYDVTGAGDMVLSMMAVAAAAGNDYDTAVQLANIAGGIEVEKFGVATVTTDEIVSEIIKANTTLAGKIHKFETLTSELVFHRQQRRKIVFTNGCFDVIHRGHIEFLKFCADQGDIVVVGLNSDSSVKEIKGPQRPINNQHDRSEVLAAFETVNYIIIFDEPDPLKTIEKVCPDVLVKGVDWKDKGVIGREFVESHGGSVILAPLVDGKSSTATIEKMEQLERGN